ncbi:sorting nexin-12 isoform X6 [Arvicanthis niloticus]|uniref:sorting nexin-12 isoform X6 n=1 Tax=Arvicanthis niloticus TaxID=61156 RepID=UPI00402B4C75
MFLQMGLPSKRTNSNRKTNLPIFKLKESCVRRRYSDFEWLKNELERDSKIVVPPLPGKALKRQLPFRGDEGIFEESFIEERRQGLEQFINKIAGHPLAQNERCLHMFLQEEAIDRNYVPGKINIQGHIITATRSWRKESIFSKQFWENWIFACRSLRFYPLFNSM